MRASTEKNRPVSIHPEGAQYLQRLIGTHLRLGRIVFDAADVLNPLSRNAERDPAFAVFGFLHANQIKTTKGWRDQKKETAEAPFRSLRQARVDEREREAASPRFGGEIRPDLGFHQNHADRSDSRVSATHDRPKIERTVKYFHSFARFLSGEGKAGGRRRGEHAEKFR